MPEILGGEPKQIKKPTTLDEQFTLKTEVKNVLKALKNTGIIPQEIRDKIESLLELEKADYSDKLTKPIADYEAQGFIALAGVSAKIDELEIALENFDNKVI